jgi:SAM-dependent methyltransferase
LDGYVNVDWQTSVSPDVQVDLNLLPLPFDSNSVDEIRAHHIIEHLNRPFEIMKEFHRILKPNALISIKVPHFSRGFTHAEHCHGFDVTFPYYFSPTFTKSGYVGVEFRLEKLCLRWLSFFELLEIVKIHPMVIFLLKILNGIFTPLANISPSFCSRIWCFWVGGFDEIEFEFRCIKP